MDDKLYTLYNNQITEVDKNVNKVLSTIKDGDEYITTFNIFDAHPAKNLKVGQYAFYSKSEAIKSFKNMQIGHLFTMMNLFAKIGSKNIAAVFCSAENCEKAINDNIEITKSNDKC